MSSLEEVRKPEITDADALRLLAVNQIELDLDDHRSPSEVLHALHFDGHQLIGVEEQSVSMGIEMTGTYDLEDVERMRQLGQDVLPTAFGQEVRRKYLSVKSQQA